MKENVTAFPWMFNAVEGNGMRQAEWGGGQEKRVSILNIDFDGFIVQIDWKTSHIKFRLSPIARRPRGNPFDWSSIDMENRYVRFFAHIPLLSLSSLKSYDCTLQCREWAILQSVCWSSAMHSCASFFSCCSLLAQLCSALHHSLD